MRRVPVVASAFGIYQAGHIVVNGSAMFGDGARTFPDPPGGWTDQTVDWARGMAIVDFVVAVGSIVFVVGFLRGDTWARDLGVVVTTAFSMAAAMFAVGVTNIGAFGEHPAFYLTLLLAGLSGPILLVLLLADGSERHVRRRAS